MRKEILCVLIGFLFFSTVSYSQNAATDSSCGCVKAMDKLSYYWKLDSLASNGFRLNVYKELLNCKPDDIYRGFLLDRLGNPNQTWKTNKGHEYVYYYYDGSKDPRQKKGLLECLYISFKFGIYDKYLSSIQEGVLDK